MFHPDLCVQCGTCLSQCPTLSYPVDKAKEEIKKLIDKKPTPVTAECITCAACNTFCPEGANPFDLINDRQEETGDFKVGERSIAMMSGAPMMPTQVIEGDTDKPTLSLCSVGGLIPGAIEGRLFEGLTILTGGDYFCYIGWIHLGKPSMVREHAEKTVRNLAATGAAEIVCYHDDCYALLANKAPEMGIDVPFRPIHFIEYLRDYVKDNLNDVTPLNMKVAYQQPCASRYSMEKDPILDELFGYIGVERVEREYDRDRALCCSGPMRAMENVSDEEVFAWRNKNVDDAKDHGAEAMIYLCPLCALALRYTANEAGLESYMIGNLVRKALGEELPLGGVGQAPV
ncbi:MAG: (Fe-S)-binding protein [Deltaproteobacteria bacterium]|nr:(Fe-S)-binding protein [Candidatus Zymogenaceae bacterium]